MGRTKEQECYERKERRRRGSRALLTIQTEYKESQAGLGYALQNMEQVTKAGKVEFNENGKPSH